MPKVYFVNEIVEVEAESGQTIQAVANANGITLHRGFWSWAHCRGIGLCGSCKVWVKPLGSGAALSDKGFLERIKPGIRGLIRLGCQARILADCEITTKPGGPRVEQTTEWLPDPRPWKWKERIKAADAEGDAEDGAAKPAPAAPAAPTAAARAPTAAKPPAAPDAKAAPAARPPGSADAPKSS